MGYPAKFHCYKGSDMVLLTYNLDLKKFFQILLRPLLLKLLLLKTLHSRILKHVFTKKIFAVEDLASNNTYRENSFVKI